MRRTTIVVAGLVLLTSLTSCAGSTADSRTYDLVEYSIVGPSQIDPDTNAIHITNSGEFPHTLVVTDAGGDVVAASGLIGPGETAELPLELEPGRYGFTCRIVAQDSEGNLIDHYEEGMSTTISVRG